MNGGTEGKEPPPPERTRTILMKAQMFCQTERESMTHVFHAYIHLVFRNQSVKITHIESTPIVYNNDRNNHQDFNLNN